MRVPILVSVIFALTFCGCSYSPNSAPIPTNSNTKQADSVGSSTPTLLNRKTPTIPELITSIPIASSTFEATSTSIAQSFLGANCWSIHDSFPNGTVPDNRLALLPAEPEALPYFMDFQVSKEIVFPEEGEKLIDVRVSPNGKWLTGQSLKPQVLYVVKSTGKTYTKIPYQAGWGTISQWINDSTVLIQEDDNYPLNTLFAVNPFTREVKELPHLFPGIDKIRVEPWDHSGLTIYDPKLQLVVYPELSYDGNVITLWDLGKRAPVLRLQNPKLNPNPMPKWSQDGEKLVFTGLYGHPLSLVYRDGTIKNSEINLDEKYYSIINLTSWSPDGRYLAFWLEPRKGPFGLHLMIWDTVMDNVIDTCIPSDVNIPEFGYPNLPFWTPNSKYLAVKAVRTVNQNQEQVSEWDVLVVDFESKFSVKVAGNAIPLGWMTK